MFSAVHNSLISLIYPFACRICGSQVESLRDGIACGQCWTSTRIFNGSEMLCYKCGAFIGNEAQSERVNCHSCDADHYEAAIAVGIYEKALSATILELKSTPRLPARLLTPIDETLKRHDLSMMDIIVPVPLSKARRLERGFNQSEIIANEIGRRIGLPVDAASLTRMRNTPIHRIGMDKKARQLTIHNAFNVTRPKLVDGKNILLVDDVFTSGATTSGCAKVLKQNGAKRVVVITLARAVLR